MDTRLKEHFIEKWREYFPGAELPITFYYTDEKGHGEPVKATPEWRCVICDLAMAREGKPIYFEKGTIGCGGGQRYFGFETETSPDFEYFLSCGIPGKMEGIRYKKTPDLVRETSEFQPPFEVPKKYIVFKRWDKLTADDDPLAVNFFAGADTLSGLFSLANFDEADPNAVIAPSCSGCSSVVYYPYHESLSPKPRAILGMFDISARPCVPGDALTFSVPFSKFVRMVENMEESFLITEQWGKLKNRLERK